ncbi:MAG: low specificity L-threonine aldolase [Oscillospiraceae bacterium]|nr:low specificity L-threonine aldolase [Oscillospiraceae bacterium]
MLRFECDYTEGCIPEILDAIKKENHTQLCGYSEDPVCDRARDKIKALCGDCDVDVHFLVGGTQANTTVIASAIRPYQGVISAQPGHINCHETGAIEATGHKVLAIDSENGRLSAAQIRNYCAAHWSDSTHEHIVQPGMVYLSHPAENGTLYSLQELEDIRAACDEWNLTLFVDGARLGYGLAAPCNDVSISDLARLTDVFYIGGTKVGALFGEAVVIRNKQIKKDFRYMIKRQGGMLAKGWLLGVQFETLFEEDRYFAISKKAVAQALRIKEAFEKQGCKFLIESWTNQQFPILHKDTLRKFDEHYTYSVWQQVDDDHIAVRFCTSWATTEEQVDALVKDIGRFV